jgi:hypothetical protein
MSSGEGVLVGCRGAWFSELTWLLFSGNYLERLVPMKKRIPLAGGDESPATLTLAPLDTVLFQKLPNLMSHLCVVRFEDGTPRRPGKLMLESHGASFKVILKEPDADLEMVLGGPTIDDVFALVDLMLGAEKAPWVPDPWAANRRNGKRKN